MTSTERRKEFFSRLLRKLQWRPPAARVDSSLASAQAPARKLNFGSVKAFYEDFFAQPDQKFVVQVGANDGMMCDPLRGFLSSTGDFEAVLIEPVPFYYEKLRKLYAGDSRVTVVNAACGTAPGKTPLYYIDPAVADEMDGDGPPNGWAHGQGSFDKDIIHYWIERNRFRGASYVHRIEEFHAAVKQLNVEVVTVSSLWKTLELSTRTLLVIDAQGAEYDVLQGVDWNSPPEFIVFEVDSYKAQAALEFMATRDYQLACREESDALFACRSRLSATPCA